MKTTVVQGVLRYTRFGLHGFRYTRLRKTINIKKIVRFTMQNSVIQDFRACSSEILFLHDSRFTQRSQEHNPAYN